MNAQPRQTVVEAVEWTFPKPQRGKCVRFLEEKSFTATGGGCFRRWIHDGVTSEQKNLKTITVVLFVLSLVGLSAPLTGLIASGYLMPRRDRLWKCGPLYSFLAWMTLVVSGVFATAIAVFAIFEWA